MTFGFVFAGSTGVAEVAAGAVGPTISGCGYGSRRTGVVLGKELLLEFLNGSSKTSKLFGCVGGNIGSMRNRGVGRD